MPDRDGNFKGVALGGKAGETWERIFGQLELLTTPEVRARYDAMVAENFVDVAYLECECGPDDCPCCCRCGLDPAPEGAGSDQD